MSADHFHVHGAHEHAVEHGAEVAHKPHHTLNQWVALFTAVLSAIGAVTSYQGSTTQTEAMLYKNEAILNKTAAADQWAFFQSQSIKEHTAQLMSELATADKQAAFKAEVQKREEQKAAIKVKADELEKWAKEADERSAHLMHPHHLLERALTFIQIAIALASITVLTRQRWLFVGGIALAIIGSGHAGWAFYLLAR